MSWQSPLRSAPAWRTVVVLLVVIVLTFAVCRVLVDVSNVAAGSISGDGPDRQYARHPGLAYVRILTAVPYLLLAPLQLWRPFRERHFPVHRRIGRIVVPSRPSALSPPSVSGCSTLSVGWPSPWRAWCSVAGSWRVWAGRGLPFGLAMRSCTGAG